MKKKLSSVILILALALAYGCSNESEDPSVSNEEQVIFVKLPDVLGTRAVEAPQADGVQGTTLDDVTAFLLADNYVVQTETFSSAELTNKEKRIEQAPGNINNVVIVANANGASISALRHYNDIVNFAFTVAQQHPAGKTGIEGRTLIGEGAPVEKADPQTGHDPDHIYKEVEITLNSITARIEIGDANNGTGIESVELLAVYINNYYTDNAKATVSFEGSDWAEWPGISASPSKTPITFDPATAIVPTDYTEAKYVDKHSDDVKLEASSKAYAYHVFTGNLPHVILLVKGKYTPEYTPKETGTGDDMPYFIGWVTYKKYKEGNTYITAMEPNYIYKMGVGANGILINAQDIRPLPEQKDYDLAMKVTIAPWTAKTVTPEV